MTRKQLTLLLAYFNLHSENHLIRFEYDRISQNTDLPTRRYIKQKIAEAPEPELELGEYMVAIANLAKTKNSTINLIASHTDLDWEKEKKTLVKHTNTLLEALRYPTYSLS